ncbi:hypothetical protein OH76DRAFT_1402990 [Lentinus brumalis]|uniref:Uncharacterized protein n=1 Tax=Lentinus brumalis TaxID=2498619 RepID=A0A371DC54_9APHY|nr:hypothetical protein OH76DRAFT_1402990 [Polyporus brumalis]
MRAIVEGTALSKRMHTRVLASVFRARRVAGRKRLVQYNVSTPGASHTPVSPRRQQAVYPPREHRAWISESSTVSHAFSTPTYASDSPSPSQVPSPHGSHTYLPSRQRRGPFAHWQVLWQVLPARQAPSRELQGMTCVDAPPVTSHFVGRRCRRR